MTDDSIRGLQERIATLEAQNQKLQAQQEAVAAANAHSAELMVELDEAREEVDERNRQLRGILDNVASGFLVVGRDLVISPVVTRSCEALFGTSEVASGRLDRVLNLDQHQASALELAVDEVFEDVMPEQLLVDQLPRRFVVGERILDFSGTVLRDEDGAVDGVLFTVLDVTQLEHDSREVSLSHALISILRQRESFRELVMESKILISAGREAVTARDWVVVRRVLHTLKGMFGCYALEGLCGLVHALEDAECLPLDAMDQVEIGLQAFLQDNFSVLQQRYDGDVTSQTHVISEAMMASLTDVATRGDVAAVIDWVRRARGLSVGQVLGPVEEMVAQMAMRVGKRAELIVSGRGVRMDKELMGPVIRELPHLLRNAVAHGIEPSSSRGTKPTTGRIEMRVEEHGEFYRILVSDDGRGIDEDKLRAAARGRGAAAHDLLALMALDGVSTAVDADHIAGRGVGVASVYRAVVAVGGTLSVSTRLGAGTTFSVRVPREPSVDALHKLAG